MYMYPRHEILNIGHLLYGPWECKHVMLGVQYESEPSRGYIPMTHITEVKN